MEPNVQIASQWWPEMENVWTPVGWKDHLFRFVVFYTGVILAEPHPASVFPKKHTEPWRGQGVQITILPTTTGKDPRPKRCGTYQLTDFNGNRTGYQGWLKDHATPVLWTQWRQVHGSQNGLVLRQEFFAHVRGGQDVETGIEPLFGWIRLSVEDTLEMIPRDHVGFLVKINAPHMRFSMDVFQNPMVEPEKSRYPRDLHMEMLSGENRSGYRIVEDNDKVRLAVLPGKAGKIDRVEDGPDEKDYTLHLILKAEKGAFADILLPFIPTELEIVDWEMVLGYDGALEESDVYWSRKPDTAATIVTPEPYINDAIDMHAKFAEVVAEKNPETGEYSALTAPIHYANVWATPVAMLFHMALDPMGYHSVVEKYLRIFKSSQGATKPPGPAFEDHPGYLGSPRSVSSIDWLTDHGAILHAICEHALLSHNEVFIAEYTDTIIKACEFIRDARRMTGHGGVLGTMPPACATDRELAEQSLWTDGWNYKGLATAVRLLGRIGHPRALEFEQEVADYKRTVVRALKGKMKGRPFWVDLDGKQYPLVPTALTDNSDETHQFYLDTGPLFLVFAGLMEADDELMANVLRFFRKGPNHRTFDPKGNYSQPPVLIHEMSSSEPGYSWNVYHSHQLGDRYGFLEGMYSLFTGALCRNTFSGCETRGGIHGLTCTFALAFNLARLSVIDDLIEPDSLHLLRLVPLAWLSEERETLFENMATEFGPLTLRFRLEDKRKTLSVVFEPCFRYRPEKVVLHAPPMEELSVVRVNSEELRVKPGDAVVLNVADSM